MYIYVGLGLIKVRARICNASLLPCLIPLTLQVLSKQELTTLVTLSATIPDVFIVAEVGVERYVKFLPLLDYSRE